MTSVSEEGCKQIQDRPLDSSHRTSSLTDPLPSAGKSQVGKIPAGLCQLMMHHLDLFN